MTTQDVTASTGLARASQALEGRAPTRGGVPSAVADALREGILDGSLEPGTWLREAEVSRELKVSRTPVRDAFRILAAEGLVDITVNLGAVVSRTTSDDVLEVYMVREALEGVAFRLASRRASQRCLDEFATLIPDMKRAAEGNQVAELSRLFSKFHAIVCEACGNRYLQRSLRQLQNAARRFPDPTLNLPGRIDESLQEHLDLADAVVRGDSARAEQLAVAHMRHLTELRVRMLLTG